MEGRSDAMLHPLLIAVHALCALASFALGLIVITRPAPASSTLFRLYLATLTLMVVFLISVVLVDWGGLDMVKRLVFLGLLLLALYTGWRGWHAGRVLARRRGHWRSAYIDDVGFTLIALFDGFVIVSAIDLGAPTWLVIAVGALGIVVGRAGVVRQKERSASPASVVAEQIGVNG